MIDAIVTASIGVATVVASVLAFLWLLERHGEVLVRMAEFATEIAEGAAETASKAIGLIVALGIIIAACAGFYKLGAVIQGYVG